MLISMELMCSLSDLCVICAVCASASVFRNAFAGFPREKVETSAETATVCEFSLPMLHGSS